MKLYPLAPTSRTAINMFGISRRLKLGVATTKPDALEGLVIVSDGTPDDVVVSVISYHVNGKTTVGVVKPLETRGLGAIQLIPTYLRPGIRKIMLLTDQDEKTLEAMREEALQRLGTVGAQVVREVDEGRLKVWECVHGARGFQFIVAISGIDEFGTAKHSIEDHLLKAAMTFNVGGIQWCLDVRGDSKEEWMSIAPHHLEVFGLLRGSYKSVCEVFPQQVKGLKCVSGEDNPRDDVS